MLMNRKSCVMSPMFDMLLVRVGCVFGDGLLGKKHCFDKSLVLDEIQRSEVPSSRKVRIKSMGQVFRYILGLPTQ